MVILSQILYISENNADAEVTVSDIKSIMGVTKPAISQSLNALENRGYISRSIASGDRRSVALCITPEGCGALREQKQQIDLFLDRLIEKFGSENLKQLMDLFSRLMETVETIKDENSKKKEG